MCWLPIPFPHLQKTPADVPYTDTTFTLDFTDNVDLYNMTCVVVEGAQSVVFTYQGCTKDPGNGPWHCTVKADNLLVGNYTFLCSPTDFSGNTLPSECPVVVNVTDGTPPHCVSGPMGPIAKVCPSLARRAARSCYLVCAPAGSSPGRVQLPLGPMQPVYRIFIIQGGPCLCMP